MAALDETLLERWLEDDYDEAAWLETLRGLVMSRACFPVLSGAGLTGDGVDGLLRLLPVLLEKRWDPDGPVRCRVFRVRHDADGRRLCYVKMLRGTLRVRDTLTLPDGPVTVSELRAPHGSRLNPVQTVSAGEVAVIPGLPGLRPGDEPGGEGHGFLTEPMMAAELLWDTAALPAFRLLERLRPLE